MMATYQPHRESLRPSSQITIADLLAARDGKNILDFFLYTQGHFNTNTNCVFIRRSDVG